MKSTFPKSYLFLLIIPILSSGFIMAQEGGDLATAVAHQDLEKVKNLVESGLDINYQKESAGATALILSARYLIEKGTGVSI